MFGRNFPKTLGPVSFSTKCCRCSEKASATLIPYCIWREHKWRCTGRLEAARGRWQRLSINSAGCSAMSGNRRNGGATMKPTKRCNLHPKWLHNICNRQVLRNECLKSSGRPLCFSVSSCSQGTTNYTIGCGRLVPLNHDPQHELARKGAFNA